jgi:hypothetical protein
MEPYVEFAEHHGYQIQEIIVKGNFGSVHNVPKETVDRMLKNFEI